MITSEDNAGVPKFNSVKQYEESFKLVTSDVNNLKRHNQVLRDGLRQILECTSREVGSESVLIVMMRETARLTLESCDNRPECKHCNHSPVCKDELKQNLEGECPYYE